MFRGDFIKLANIRIKEASFLYKSKNYSGAYYLAGYSIECALKACIAQKTRQHEFPDKKFVNDSYTHNLKDLLRLTGLKIPTDPIWQGKWNTIKDWNEESRYKVYNSTEAFNLIDSIIGRKGVLTWIKEHW